MIDEILDMGFDTIEISHGLKVSLIPGIQRAYAKGKFRCSGVHNYCPSPVEVMIDAPDCYEFTSYKPYERERALKLTLTTLETAAEFNAGYVVLHMGSVPMKRDSKLLSGMIKEGNLNSREYVKLKHKIIQKREKLAPLYFSRAMEALEKIAEKAAEVGVPVAVESRSTYEVKLQEHFADNPWVGYWHDFGHVQLKENISLLDHEEWLTKMQPYLIGCHLHDVEWPARDHRVPFYGEVKFDRLVPIVPEGKPFVWELSPTRKKSQIKHALPLWKARYPETL
jgi:sugar phosphate isomerase/epimerase